jgi:hypothetical protein
MDMNAFFGEQRIERCLFYVNIYSEAIYYSRVSLVIIIAGSDLISASYQ